jgi:hypothetical protein
MKARPPKTKMNQDALREFIHSCRGSLKRKPGEKPFAEWWAEHKREEKDLEEAKFQRMVRAGLFPATRNSTRSKRKSKSTC